VSLEASFRRNSISTGISATEHSRSFEAPQCGFLPQLASTIRSIATFLRRAITRFSFFAIVVSLFAAGSGVAVPQAYSIGDEEINALSWIRRWQEMQRM
jgi:hypothetical protein